MPVLSLRAEMMDRSTARRALSNTRVSSSSAKSHEFCTLLEGIIVSPDAPSLGSPLLTPAEWEQLLVE
jgi:hypothetical protein